MAKKKDKHQEVEELAEELMQQTPRLEAIPDSEMLSAGSVLENLAFSGRPNVGIPKGNYVCMIGGSGSTKTWKTHSWFAEAARNDNFKKHRFIFDNVENGALWDVRRFFGEAVCDRLEPPYKNVIGSATVEQFYWHLSINCDAGPCIYVLDSQDALGSEAVDGKFAAELKHYQTGEGKVPGSMGMEKARTHSDYISRMVRSLRKNGSILVVIGQYREKPGRYAQKVMSGGYALRFYAHIRTWMEVTGTINKTYLDKERNIGSYIQVEVQKNRVCGWEDRFTIEYLKNYGVDDIGTSISWLVWENHWEGGEGTIVAPEFDFKGRRERLIRQIQDDNLEGKLAEIVTSHWKKIIEGSTPDRKAKYP